MTKKNTKVFVAFISILFILSVFYFVGSIIYTMNQGEHIASDQFDSFVKDISQLSERYNYESEEFITNAKLLANANDHIAAVLLSTNNSTFLAYPISSDYFYMGTDGNPTISVSSPMVKMYTSNLSPLNNSNLLIQIATYTLLPSSIFNYGRIAFIVILVCTLAILVAIIACGKPKDDVKEEAISTNYVKSTEDAFSLDDIHFQTEESNVPISSSPIDNGNYSEEPITPTDSLTESITTPQSIPDEEVTPLAKSEDPTGLFSDVTGFGWESYFETRLDSELIRAASSEQDLALFYVNIENLESNSIILPEICQILLDYFKFRDLIFEHGKNSFACICQNTDLNSSMILAEDIYASILSVINSSEVNTKIAIGISNRSIRLISGSRIMEETEQALAHAKQEKDLPIVAYKVNPDKYRQYLAEENVRLQKVTGINTDNQVDSEHIPVHV